MTLPTIPSLLPDTPITTMVVEDDAAVREVLARFLTTLGHEVVALETAADALAAITRRKVTLILLDLRLPDALGTELVPRLLEHERHAAIVMITASNDAHAAALSLQRGAMDYLVKPVGLPDLERAIARALARRDEQIQQEEMQDWLKQEIVRRGADLQRERQALEHVSVATLEALVNALEAKDRYLRGHSARIADLAALVASELGLADEQVETVRTAGRLHDIGKIGIRESVLHKRGPLNEEEFEHVRTHVVIGAQILSPLTHLQEVIGFVRAHHERVDGSGYPDALAGDAIPLGARIIGTVEVFDALTTSRPYQERMEPRDAVARMRDLVGTVLDPKVLQALSEVVSQGKALTFLDERQ